eukprot:TRINITY_DN5627_c0_g1_i5.p1 TRINITY_DN5627_c0_g1~~TRINITY_DN5627_c0_g1_i5.p1  ORF type:complete len:295 (+),score=72.76 TRINITY_DN5627_c0_g1_i5:2-886(+)
MSGLSRANSGRGKVEKNARLSRTKSVVKKMTLKAETAQLESFYRPLFMLIDNDPPDHKVELQELINVAQIAFSDKLEAQSKIKALWPQEPTVPESLNANAWVRAWHTYWSTNGVAPARELMFALLIAANQVNDSKDSGEIENLLRDSQDLQPDDSLILDECSETFDKVKKLWEELDFLADRQGNTDDSLQEAELLFLNSPAFKTTFKDLDTNNNGSISGGEWEDFWEDRLQKGGKNYTNSELDLAIWRVSRVKESFTRASTPRVGDGFQAAVDAVHSENAVSYTHLTLPTKRIV